MARILVIDDDRSLLRMMKLMLEKAGHESILASGGREGIQSAIDEQPDLAIVDVMMPEFNGLEVLTEIRKNPDTEQLPVIIMTANAQRFTKEEAENAGVSAFLTKPFSPTQLMSEIRKQLGEPNKEN